MVHLQRILVRHRIRSQNKFETTASIKRESGEKPELFPQL